MARRLARLLCIAVVVVGVLSGCGRAPNPAGDGGPSVVDRGYPPVDAPIWPRDWGPPPDGWPRYPDVRPPWPDLPPIPDWSWPHLDAAIAEKVTCLFAGASTIQSCSSSKGSACSGVGSCTVWVYGAYGEKVEWKSTCGGFGITYIDGSDEKVSFPCGAPTIAETVTCNFLGSTTGQAQACYSSKGPSCTGVSSCQVTVNGYPGEPVSWKSSCPGSTSAMTIIDGKPDTVSFPCSSMPVKEVVTCYFKGSTTYQTCTSSKGSCQGLLGCALMVSGTMGETVQWKSSCGGLATTMMDGKDDSAYFYCGPVAADGGPWPPPPPWPPDAGVIPWP